MALIQFLLVPAMRLRVGMIFGTGLETVMSLQQLRRQCLNNRLGTIHSRSDAGSNECR
jgi:hypothetical protein